MGGELEMNKSELVDTIATKVNESKKSAETNLDAIIEIISNELKNKNKVQLVGFGSFETRKRASRKGRNPRTNEEINIPASTVPFFKPGKALKETVNK